MMNAIRSAAARPGRALPPPGARARVRRGDRLRRPGNFATNFAAGSEFGYPAVGDRRRQHHRDADPVPVRLGLATGRNLPEVCRDTFPRQVSIGLWVQAECVAIATDLAEVIGGAVALYLLFGLPLPIGGLVTGVVAFGLLALQERGHRPFERAVAGLFAVIVIGFVITVLRVPIEIGQLAAAWCRASQAPEPAAGHGHPQCDGDAAVIYLHSALTCQRDPQDTVAQRHRSAGPRRRVLVAMGLAGLVNAAMLVVAARSSRPEWNGAGIPDTTPSKACTPVWPRPHAPQRPVRLALLASASRRRCGNVRGRRDAGLRATTDPLLARRA
jgi:manganese transport protein